MLLPSHTVIRTFLFLVCLVIFFNVIYFRRLISYPSRQYAPSSQGNSWLTQSHDVAALPPCRIDSSLEDRMAAARVAGSDDPPDALRHLTGFETPFGPPDECYNRRSRLDPYGFERDEDQFWAQFKWDEMIGQCSEENGLPQPRDFNAPEILMLPEALKEHGDIKGTKTVSATPKTAVVFRAYEGADYSGDMIPYLRSMIMELSLKSGGQYQVFLFVEVQDEDSDIYSDRDLYERKLAAAVPPEFQGITYLWNKRLLREWYPYLERHNVYYQEYQGLQLFATMLRPDMDFFWQFEMDMRASGPHLHMLESIGKWTRNQTREGLADLNSALYMPSQYGDYENFRELVASDRKVPHFSQRVAYGSTLGSGEEADLITLNPIVDIRHTEWVFKSEIWNDPTPHLPAMVAPVSMTRTSKQLLQLIHDLQVTTGFYIGSEGTPETVATRYGLKAVYYPHPVYYDGPQTESEFALDHNPGFTRGYGRFHNTQNKHLSFWWKGTLGQRMWESLLSQDACLPPSIVHPFKVGNRPKPEGEEPPPQDGQPQDGQSQPDASQQQDQSQQQEAAQELDKSKQQEAAQQAADAQAQPAQDQAQPAQNQPQQGP